MIVKIIIYIVIVVGLMIGEQRYNMLSIIGISKGPYVAVLLFFVYGGMLYVGVKSNINMQKSYDEVRRYGFIFSFCVGVVWGILMSFAAGFHYKINLLDVILMIGGYAIVGGVFGLFGRVISEMLWKRFLKKPTIEAEKEMGRP